MRALKLIGALLVTLSATGCATNTVVKPVESVCVWGKIITLTGAEIDALSDESLRIIVTNNDGYVATCLKQ